MLQTLKASHRPGENLLYIYLSYFLYICVYVYILYVIILCSYIIGLLYIKLYL